MNGKHYISKCDCNKAREAQKIDLFEWSVLATLPEYAAEKKDDSQMIYAAYN